MEIKDGKTRGKAFHHDDAQITVDDLWARWVNSEGFFNVKYKI